MTKTDQQSGTRPAHRDGRGDGGHSAPAQAGGDAVAPRTRTASLFATSVAGLVLAVLMLVFVLQNDARQQLEFLWLDFELPTGVAMLLSAVVGALIVASLALGRLVQLRLAARRHRQAVHRGS